LVKQLLGIGGRGLRSTVLALALALPSTTALTASVVFTNSDPATVVMAIEQAGTVRLMAQSH